MSKDFSRRNNGILGIFGTLFFQSGLLLDCEFVVDRTKCELWPSLSDFRDDMNDLGRVSDNSCGNCFDS